MYSEYCRLRDEVPGYIEVDNIEFLYTYEFMDPQYVRRTFCIFHDEIEEDLYKYYVTHAFKYCLDNNTIWFDEYVVGDHNIMEDFMRCYMYGMNVVFVDSDDLEFDLDAMYDMNEINLYDVPIHARYLSYGSGITHMKSEETLELIEKYNDDINEIKRLLHIYRYGIPLEDREYNVHELLLLGYSHEDLIKYMKYSDEYRRIYVSKNIYMNPLLSHLFTGYYHWYYTIDEPWNGTIREYYMSCPQIKKKYGSTLVSKPHINSPKPIWTKK